MGQAADSEGSTAINRRDLLASLGAVSTAAIAGCSANPDDETPDDTASPEDDGDSSAGGQQLGERVPTIDWHYNAAKAFTPIMEKCMQIVKPNVEDALGVEVNVQPHEKPFSCVGFDKRCAPIYMWQHSQPLSRLDPADLTTRWRADWAGGNGKGNTSNWAHCEYTDLAVQQSQAATTEERRELVHQAHSIMSNDKAQIQLFPSPKLSSIRTDVIEPKALGKVGFKLPNPRAWALSEVNNENNRIVAPIRPEMVLSRNYRVLTGKQLIAGWSVLVHSCLTEYNENFELENVLAENIEVEDNAQTITVELKDATFHNGDPITSEDVKFTFESVQNNTGVYPQASEVAYESIDIIDEKTTQFTFQSPSLFFLGAMMPKWGILHKQSWIDAGFEDDPETDIPDLVGSGPFEIVNWEQNESMHLQGFQDHPVHSTQNEVIFQVSRSASARRQAFQQGEVNVIPITTPSDANQLKERLGDNVQVHKMVSFTSFAHYPQSPQLPVKWPVFRDALGKVMDREKMVAVALQGQGEPELYSCNLGKGHPWRPPDDMLHQFTDDPTGDPEAAKQVLSDAGWGWDDDGNLHYPPDADMQPLWPSEGNPGQGTSETRSFPCVNPDTGEYVPPEER